jgi:hypothetical protein
MRKLGFDGVPMAAIGPVILMAALCLAGAGCTPTTDLIQGQSGTTADPGGLGTAAGALVDPPAGTTDVPWNLAAVTVRLPAAITIGDDGPFRLRRASAMTDEASLGAPAAVSCAMAGACYRVPITGGLAPSDSYVFELLPGTVGADGTPAAAGVIGAFDTSADADQTAPQITGMTLTPSGPCVNIGFTTDEPVDAEVVLQGGGSEVDVPAGAGETTFTLAVPLSGLPSAVSAEVILQITDRAGNLTQTSAGQLDVPSATPPLVITEVLANPIGTEPAQEFVELRNIGADPVSLEGLRIEDSKGSDVLPAVTVPPGAYALVVPSSYDPQSARDVPPLAGTLLARVDARIGSDGLSNSGEVVRLRMPGTADEPVISIYNGWVDVSATKSAGKSAHRLADDACDQASAWTAPPRPATPGWGTPPP